jgi:hypothetical protein
LLYEQQVVKPTRVLLKQRDLSPEEEAERKSKMQELLQREVDDDDF